MSKSKLPILIVLVVLAAAGGLFATGKIGGGQQGPVKKHLVPEIQLMPQDDGTFMAMTSDIDSKHYVLLKVAVRLAPMDEKKWATFTGANAGGHGGGSGESPGAVEVAKYPKYLEAVNDTVAQFTAAELRQVDGKKKFKTALLQKFSTIAEQDSADAKSYADAADANYVGPPFEVDDVILTQFLPDAA